MDPTAAVEIRPATASDEEAIRRLITEADLTTADLERWIPHFVVASRDSRVVGAAGLEIHGRDGILRSVVVDPDARGLGLGGRLTGAVVAAARDAGLRRLYLLTETAGDYFPRHGFQPVDRAAVSRDAQRSVEFRGACPDTALVMERDL